MSFLDLATDDDAIYVHGVYNHARVVDKARSQNIKTEEDLKKLVDDDANVCLIIDDCMLPSDDELDKILHKKLHKSIDLKTQIAEEQDLMRLIKKDMLENPSI